MQLQYSLRTLLLVVTGCAITTSLVVTLFVHRETLSLIDIYRNADMIALVQEAENVQVSRIGGKHDPRGFCIIDELDLSDLVVLDADVLDKSDMRYLLEMLSDPRNFAFYRKSCGTLPYQMQVKLSDSQGINAVIYISFECDHAIFVLDGEVIGGADTDPMKNQLKSFYEKVFFGL